MERFFINQSNDTVAIVGGVRMLSEFSPEQVVVAVHGAQVAIKGSNLKIARFDENEIEVLGKIENVETISSRKRTV